VFGKPMSRIGRQPIKIPENVTLEVKEGEVRVEGPKGNLTQRVRPELKVVIKEGQVLVSRRAESKLGKSLHGLTRTLIANMIEGVSQGWEKRLEMHGTGYRASLEGESLVLTVGFSHPVKIKPAEGITFQVEGNDKIIVAGSDKALVGQVAAQIRRIRPPEPYKGKGIRYEGEKVRLKPGKAAKVGAGAPGAGGENQ
jgi:large subunit ribosomal protein L6